MRDQRGGETRRAGPQPSPYQPPSPYGPATHARGERVPTNGTPAYLAAYHVHRAHVIGHCAPTTGIEPFSALVEKVMTSESYASARQVFWVVDNGASHRGWTAAVRLSEAFPNATMIHLPVHASWLNQIEIYFSVVQRKLLTPDDFANPDILAERLGAFEHRYNNTARPFDWRFNHDDLNRLLDQIAA